MNTQHSDFKPLILTTVQNVIGLAIATITSMHTKRIFDDVLKVQVLYVAWRLPLQHL